MASSKKIIAAEKISTDVDWDDLIVTSAVKRKLGTIINHFSDQAPVDYRALFYGPQGTGKTMSAALIAKTVKRDIYRIDLSMVVSKYIGETEKNLEKLFARAENKNWILFFDEADALFGKRTNVQDAHDKYANQEVAYLLQRLEKHNGLVIFSSNDKNNIQEQFVDIFQAIIPFPKKKKRKS